MNYTVDEARRAIADMGYIARVSRLGNRLIIYTGDVDHPGTWLELGSMAIPKDGKIRGLALANFVSTNL